MRGVRKFSPRERKGASVHGGGESFKEKLCPGRGKPRKRKGDRNGGNRAKPKKRPAGRVEQGDPWQRGVTQAYLPAGQRTSQQKKTRPAQRARPGPHRQGKEGCLKKGKPTPPFKRLGKKSVMFNKKTPIPRQKGKKGGKKSAIHQGEVLPKKPT